MDAIICQVGIVEGVWSCEDCPCEECIALINYDGFAADTLEDEFYASCDRDDYSYDLGTQDTRDAHYDREAAVKGEDPECYCPTCTAANMVFWRAMRRFPFDTFTHEDYLDTLTDTLAGVRLRAA